MRTASAKIENNTLNVELARQNVVDYLKTTEESSLNTARMLKKFFLIQIEKQQMEQQHLKSQLWVLLYKGMSATTFATTTEKLSGEIYASSQALAFCTSS